jgi:hypothetical protein
LWGESIGNRRTKRELLLGGEGHALKSDGGKARRLALKL